MSNQLSQEQILLPGQSIYSENGLYQLIYQKEGNLVLYVLPDKRPVWWSSTEATPNPGKCIMQSDGNLVLYNTSKVAYWSSGTTNPGSRLVLQNDRNLVMYNTAGEMVWASNTTATYQLCPTDSLTPGQSIYSDNNVYQFTYQTDGNLVLYVLPHKRAVWSIGVGSPIPGKCTMQFDGNLVVYDANGNSYWNSGTEENPGSRLVVQNDRNLVIYDSGGKALWSSETPMWSNNTKINFAYDKFDYFDPQTLGLTPETFPYELVAIWVPLFWYTDDSYSRSDRDLTVCRPLTLPGWNFLGQYAIEGEHKDFPEYKALLVKPVKGKDPLARPDGFSRVWGVRQDNQGWELGLKIAITILGSMAIVAGARKGESEHSQEIVDGMYKMWTENPIKFQKVKDEMSTPFHGKRMGLYTPNAPAGYVGLSDVWENTENSEDLLFADYACIRKDLLKPTQYTGIIWNDQGSEANDDGSVLSIATDPRYIQIPAGKPAVCFFKAFPNYPDVNQAMQIQSPYTLDWSKVFFLK